MPEALLVPSTTFVYKMAEVEALRACVKCNSTLHGALECFSCYVADPPERLLQLWLPMAEDMMKEKLTVPKPN